MNFSPGRPSSLVHHCLAECPPVRSKFDRRGVLCLLGAGEGSREGEGSRGEGSRVDTCPREEGTELDGSTLGEAEVRGLFTRGDAAWTSGLRLCGTEVEEDGVSSRATTCGDPPDAKGRLGVVDFFTVTTRVVTFTVVPLPLALGALDLEKNPRSEADCRGACIIWWPCSGPEWER